MFVSVYLLYEVPEEDGLLSQGIMNQAFREEDHPVGKIVLRQPGYNTLLLHIRAARDVDNQISQVLPVPACEYITSRSNTPRVIHSDQQQWHHHTEDTLTTCGVHTSIQILF